MFLFSVVFIPATSQSVHLFPEESSSLMNMLLVSKKILQNMTNAWTRTRNGEMVRPHIEVFRQKKDDHAGRNERKKERGRQKKNVCGEGEGGDRQTIYNEWFTIINFTSTNRTAKDRNWLEKVICSARVTLQGQQID